MNFSRVPVLRFESWLFVSLLLTCQAAIAQKASLKTSPPKAMADPVLGEISGLPDALCIALGVDGEDRTFLIDSACFQTYLEPSKWPIGQRSLVREMDLNLDGTKLGHVAALTKGGPTSLKETPGVSGSLGGDFLNQVVLLVDPVRGRCALWPSKSCTVGMATQWERLHPGWSGDSTRDLASQWILQDLTISLEGQAYIPATIGGFHISLAIDTGSPMTGVSERNLDKIKNFVLERLNTELFTGPADVTYHLIPDLRTPFLARTVLTAMGIPDSYNTDGVLGLDSLYDGEWILDMRHKLLAFRSISSNRYLTIQTSKFTFYIQDGHLLIATTDPHYRTNQTFCEVLSINKKSPSVLLPLSLTPPISLADFEILGSKLQTLLAKSIVIRVKDRDDEKIFTIDALDTLSKPTHG